MQKILDDDRIHEGHRQRMRAKLLSHGDAIFDTYELLEMLLYNVIPYKDTNPIAKRLLHAFGSLDGVLSASREELMTVSGIGERTAAYICEVAKLSLVIGSEILPRAEYSTKSYDSVGELLVRYFKEHPELKVAILSLDNDMRLISVDSGEGCARFDSAGYKSSLFIDIAIRNRASIIITAQNNYYGPFCPTPGDRATADMIYDSLHSINVDHLEHYLICGDRYMGVATARAYRFSASTEIEKFRKSRKESLARLDDQLQVASPVSQSGGAKMSAPAHQFEETEGGVK